MAATVGWTRRSRTPWSAAAAACALVLGLLQARILLVGTSTGSYGTVLLGAGAATACGAALLVAIRNCVVGRAVALGVSAACAVAVLLLVGVGPPGGHPHQLDAGSLALLAAAAGVPVCAALGALHRRAGGVAAPVRIVSRRADPCAARGGRPGHRPDPRPGLGA
jgi:hypothetical protein